MAEEGMKKTQNDRISIGRPIDFDEDELEAKLAVLRECATSEGENIKELVKELVPTYKVYEDKK